MGISIQTYRCRIGTFVPKSRLKLQKHCQSSYKYTSCRYTTFKSARLVLMFVVILSSFSSLANHFHQQNSDQSYCHPFCPSLSIEASSSQTHSFLMNPGNYRNQGCIFLLKNSPKSAFFGPMPPNRNKPPYHRTSKNNHFCLSFFIEAISTQTHSFLINPDKYRNRGCIFLLKNSPKSAFFGHMPPNKNKPP